MSKFSQEWSLNDFYSSFEDKSFIHDFYNLEEDGKAFREKYYGTIPEISQNVSSMKECLEDYEKFIARLQKIYSFASLAFAADTRDKQVMGWMNKVMEKVNLAENYTLFLALNIQKLPEEKLDMLMKSDELTSYRRFFEKLLELKPHTLDEEVEKVINEMLLTGRNAFVKLRDIHIGSQDFKKVVTPDGKEVDSEQELSALLSNPDPKTRLEAYQSVRNVYKEHNKLYGYIMQKIVQDHRMDSRRRQYQSTLEKQLMDDEVSRETFETVMQVTEDNFDLFQEYYKEKARRMGVDKLRICDLMAEETTDEKEIEFDDGVEIVLNAMSRVGDKWVDMVRGFFDGRYIDSMIRKGKRGGAFCWSIWGEHPFILMSYTRKNDSLFTMAHELGHGIHGLLVNDRQKLLVADPPMVLAEVASIFNELLLLDYFMEHETDAKVKKAILTRQIEDGLNLLFRQTTISRLELDLHENSPGGVFDEDYVNENWQKRYENLVGDSVELLPLHKYDWARIGHIFFKPFYCYNYCLSYMVSLACYSKYISEGKSFLDKFVRLLASGGSRNPVDALAIVGIDPTDPVVMKSAIDYNRDRLAQLKKL